MTQPSYVQTHQLSGDHVQIDLAGQIEELRSLLGGHGRRSETVYKEGGLTVVLMTMEAGNVIPEHRTSGTSIIQVLDGRIALTAGGHRGEVAPGQLIAFAPMVAHDVHALEPSAILLTVAAIAEDSRNDDLPPERGPVAG